MITIKQRPYLYNWTGNSVYYELYSAAAAADASNIFEVRVFFKFCDAVAYTLLTTLPYVPVEGSVKFNIQDILHAHLEYLMPDLHNDGTIIEITKQTGSFYIDFREITTAESNPSWDSREVEYFRHIIRGGIHAYQFKGNNYWLNYHPAYMPFLTWQKSGRMASIRERMYLAWYCQAVVTSPNLVARVTVYFTDGSDATSDLVITNQLHRVYLIPAGATELGLQALGPAKTIWYWTIRVLDITDPDVPILQSQLFQYQLDNRNDYNDTILHYRNSLGGIDSVRIRGVIETNLQYAITETTGLLESDYFMKDQLPALDSIYKAKETVVFRGDIGHLGKEEQDRLRDAFLNRQCFRQKLSKWWPVKLLNTNNRLRTSTDKRFTLPIEWQYADGGSYFYTPDINLGEGESTNNVCGCTIDELTVDVSFNEAETQAFLTFNFGVTCPDDETIDSVEYKINGGDWVEMEFPYSFPLEVAHDIDVYGTASFRVKCNARESGPVSTVAFDTHVTPVVPVPEDNTHIINRTGLAQTIEIKINGITKFISAFAPGEEKTFELTGIWDDAIVQAICSISTPSSSYIYAMTIVIPASAFPPNSAYWNSVDITDGFFIYV